MLGGYQQGHPLVLRADTDCRIVGRLTDAAGCLPLGHDCTATMGVSGAPLPIEKKAAKGTLRGLTSPLNQGWPSVLPFCSTMVASACESNRVGSNRRCD